jgi:DNA topoisomerase-1
VAKALFDEATQVAPAPAPPALVDPRQAAEAAGLTYASTDAPGFTRRRRGKGFSYADERGRPIRDEETLCRIRALAIPPAWSNVWISPDPTGHIQAVGVDQRGRKQYRYHPKFRETRESAKFEHMMAFAEALPRLRRRVSRDMSAPGLGRSKVLATVVYLLEATMIRVGNEEYARHNKSYGLTTLLARHVEVQKTELKFHFTGKSGKMWNLNVRDRRVARIVRTLQDLPGQHLFQYIDDEGGPQTVTSADVNAYLREVTGADITAKDFRTWAGTVLAAMALTEFEAADSQARGKRNITQAIERVATRLGNTPTICRKCYVHPQIFSAYLDGGLLLDVKETIEDELSGEIGALRPEEAAVLSFLRSRVMRELEKA